MTRLLAMVALVTAFIGVGLMAVTYANMASHPQFAAYLVAQAGATFVCLLCAVILWSLR